MRKRKLAYRLGGDPPRTVSPSQATDSQRYFSQRQHQMPWKGKMSTFGEIQDSIYDSDMTTLQKDKAYAKLRDDYGSRMKRLIGHYGSNVPQKYAAPIPDITEMKAVGFGRFADKFMPRVNYDQQFDNIDPGPVMKKWGGKVKKYEMGGNIGLLSPLPNAVFPKRGMQASSLAFPKGGFETIGASNNMRDRRGRAGQLQSYGYGGELPEYNFGGALAGAGLGAKAGTALGSIIPGVGNVIGGIGGALVGGVAGWFKGKKEDEERAEVERKVTEQQRVAKQTAKLFSDTSALGTFPTMGVEGANYYAALGGPIQPQYMAEGGETLVHNQEQPAAFTGALNQISSNMSEIQGPSHASPQGGVEMSGGDFIFSKRMKASDELKADLKDLVGYAPSDTTYAGISKSIGKKKGDLETKLESSDPIAIKTAEVMLGRLDEALELVALEQENRKNKRA